jgi:hypothetical protein
MVRLLKTISPCNARIDGYVNVPLRRNVPAARGGLYGIFMRAGPASSRTFTRVWRQMPLTGNPVEGEIMLDVVFLAALAAGFSALVGYALVCAKEIDR